MLLATQDTPLLSTTLVVIGKKGEQEYFFQILFDYCWIEVNICRTMFNLKGLVHHMDIFLRCLKLRQYFLNMRQWFLNFLVGLLKENNKQRSSLVL